MKIAVNTRLLLKDKLEGIGWFTYETLKRISASHPEHHFYFIFDRPYYQDFIFSENVTPVVIGPPTRHPILWYLYFEYSIPKVLKKIKPDLFLSTDGWLSLRTNVKSVNVIHDLNFEHNPKFVKQPFRAYYIYFFHRFAQKAARLATVSEFTRQDIHALYNIPLSEIDVVYNGCNDFFYPLNEGEKKKVKEIYSEGNPYFLFVGLIHKRKNLDNIFRAFDRFKIYDDKNTKLIVVGNKQWWKGDIEDAYLAMKHKEDVIFLGRIPAEKLSRIMASALALLYVSLFEGFGIPILEAFYAETAVITSNVTSMPEVAGDAALLVNPYSVEQITNAMLKISNDNDIRETLIAKARFQRLKFSWDKTAENLWKTIEKVL
jgi:glycosyltransferase involved in cell wall biosynthesis